MHPGPATRMHSVDRHKRLSWNVQLLRTGWDGWCWPAMAFKTLSVASDTGCPGICVTRFNKLYIIYVKNGQINRNLFDL